MGTSNYLYTFSVSSNSTVWTPPITSPLAPSLPISHLGTSNSTPTVTDTPISQLGTSNYPTTCTTTCNFTHGHMKSPIHFVCLFQFHTLDTTDHSPTFAITSNFTPGHLPLPTQFQHHSQFHTEGHPISHPHLSQFHTWAPLITPLLYRSFPISYLGTSYYPSNFTTIPNSHMGTSHYLPIAHLGIHPLSPPLSISQLDTSDHPPTFHATSDFTYGHL